MSYQPPPDGDSHNDRQAAIGSKLTEFAKSKPIKFWFSLWLVFTLTILFVFYLGGSTAFDRPSSTIVLSFALFGWLVPFVLFIKSKR